MSNMHTEDDDELENDELEESISLNKELADIKKQKAIDEAQQAETLGEKLKSIRSSSIQGLIAEGVAAIIANTLKGATGLLGILALPVAAAAGAQKLFSKLIPSFAVGTDYVPRDMLAQIHKGERIVPASQNKQQQLVAVVTGMQLDFIQTKYNQRRTNTF